MSEMPVLKVIIAGDENVGKTSLVRQYCEGKFETSRVATIGVDFQTQTVQLPTDMVKLSIWDMAGQPRFRPVRHGLYRGARATALVYDVTNPESLAHLREWLGEVLDAVNPQPFVVVGNKIDLVESRESDAAHEFAASIRAPYLVTSALTGEGVSKLFTTVAFLANNQPMASMSNPDE